MTTPGACESCSKSSVVSSSKASSLLERERWTGKGAGVARYFLTVRAARWSWRAMRRADQCSPPARRWISLIWSIFSMLAVINRHRGQDQRGVLYKPQGAPGEEGYPAEESRVGNRPSCSLPDRPRPGPAAKSRPENALG